MRYLTKEFVGLATQKSWLSSLDMYSSVLIYLCTWLVLILQIRSFGLLISFFVKLYPGYISNFLLVKFGFFLFFFWGVHQVKTVSVNNVSLSASENDIKEFFSFSGDIEYVELRRLVAQNSAIIISTYFLTLAIQQNSGNALVFLMNLSYANETLIDHQIISDTERSQVAYVTFKDPQGAETAVLLSVR